MRRCTGQRGRTALHAAAASNSADAARALIEAGCALDATDEVRALAATCYWGGFGVWCAGREGETGRCGMARGVLLPLYPELQITIPKTPEPENEMSILQNHPTRN